jgi:putative oxidoreductase
VVLVTSLLSTSRDASLLITRLVLGIIFFAHGCQKMLGWFGGYGFRGTMHMFTGTMHIPAAFAFLAIVAEFFGGIGLILGFLSRIAAFGVVCEMLVAIFKVHLQNGLLGNPHGPGFEYPLALFALSLLILIKGGGALSVDGAIAGD